MYFSFKTLSLEFNEKNGKLSLFRCIDGKEQLFSESTLFISGSAGKQCFPGKFRKVENSGIPAAWDHHVEREEHKLLLFSGHEKSPAAELIFTLEADSVSMAISDPELTLELFGTVYWGEDPTACCTAGRERGLSPASGPFVGLKDNALFDRFSDSVLEFVSLCHVEYAWERSCFAFTMPLHGGIVFKIHEKWMEDHFHTPFKAISKTHGFSTPPVGWMTWYSVKFDACEETVLRNARQLKELFWKYSDKLVVWIDWEWCHADLTGNGLDGVDVFHPRKDAYPHGLKPVAEAIRELGLEPAVWTAAGNETRLNHLLKKHPDWVLGKFKTWCGHWWVDSSHPEVAAKYIPAVFRQLHVWGFRIIKWDAFTVGWIAADALKAKRHNPSIPFWTGMRRMIESARKTVGDDTYLMLCLPCTEQELSCGMGIFNATRIGGDVFAWDSFVSQVIDRLHAFYPYHNTALYTDGDNLVLRDEYNTTEQARSRVSICGLAGLPVTIGDAFSALQPERIDMLRRIVPVVNMHPRDLLPIEPDKDIFIIRSCFARSFGYWLVAGVTNLNPEKKKFQLSLQKDFELTNGKYAVWDFWREKFMGIVSGDITLELNPCDTAVLRFTPVKDIPVVISSSRHITQGGYELEGVEWKNQTLAGRVKCIGGEELRLAILVPDEVEYESGEAPVSFKIKKTGNILILALIAEENSSVEWNLKFK